MRANLKWMTLAMACCFAAVAHSGVLVDRGLPTHYLNNAAGTSRSNVAWGRTATVGFTGDDFTLPNTAPGFLITRFTTWTIGPTEADANLGDFLTDVKFWLGSGNVVEQNFALSVTRDLYAGGATYQRTGGIMGSLWRLDWTPTSPLILAPGKHFFGVSGVYTNTWTGTSPFLHASNAALGGVTADGSDGHHHRFSTLGIFQSSVNSHNNGWDKSSDINIVVTGEPIPEPFTMTLGAAALGLAALKRRRNRK